MDNLFYNNISSSSIFIYAVILCGFIVYFREVNITLGIIVGMISALSIIYLLYQYETTSDVNKKKLHQIKTENIFPTPKNISKYEDLTDFVFSVQDFYEYNPQSYEDMIHAVDTFIEVYEDVLLDHSLAGNYYSIAETHKLLALNALHSIIMLIPSSKKLIGKLNDSMKTLEILLNKYLYVIYQTNDSYVKENGYFNNTKVIDLKISPHNQYKNETMDQFY